MSEANDNAGEAGQAGDQQEAQQQGSAENEGLPQSQDELNKLISKRVAREREKFADYNDLKSTSESLSKSLEKTKTERDNLKAQIEGLEKAEQVRSLKESIAEEYAEYGIRSGVLRGESEEELREHAEDLKSIMGSRVGSSHIPRQGDVPPQAPASEELKAARSLFGGRR